MKRIAAILVIGLAATECGGGKTTNGTGPSPVPPAPTTYSLSGQVLSVNGQPISGATVRISDGPNANRSTTTDASGSYSLASLTVSGFTAVASALNYGSLGQGINLTSDQRFTFFLTPIPLFVRSGTGDNVFDMPSTVRRVRVDATYGGSCQNFIVHVSTQITSLINIIIGTCSVADTRSPFSGTYAINNGGTVTITNSTGISWTFTEVR